MNIQVIENQFEQIVIPEAHKEIFKDHSEFCAWVENQVKHFSSQYQIKYAAVIFDSSLRTWKLDTVIEWMKKNVDGRDHFFIQMNGMVMLLLTFPDTDTVTRFVLENGDK